LEQSIFSLRIEWKTIERAGSSTQWRAVDYRGCSSTHPVPMYGNLSNTWPRLKKGRVVEEKYCRMELTNVATYRDAEPCADVGRWAL